MFRVHLTTFFLAFGCALILSATAYSQPHGVSRGGGGGGAAHSIGSRGGGGGTSHSIGGSRGGSRGGAMRTGSSASPRRVSSPTRSTTPRSTSTRTAPRQATRVNSSMRNNSARTSSRRTTGTYGNSTTRRRTTTSLPASRRHYGSTGRPYYGSTSHYRPHYYGSSYGYGYGYGYPYGYGGWRVGYRIPRSWPSVYSPVYIYRDYDWYYTPRYTRPQTIYAPQTVVNYAQDDSLYWQGKIDELRRALRQERNNPDFGDPAIGEILDYASAALDDAEEMLSLGYGEADLNAAIDDASQMLNDARQERALAQAAAQSFGMPTAPIQRDPHDAYLQEQAPQRGGGDVVARAKANAARTQASYDAAAQRGANAFANETNAHVANTSKLNQLLAEQRTLQDWLHELQSLAEQWDRPETIDPLQQAQAKLTRAADAIQNKQEDRARDALDDATHDLKAALKLLSPDNSDKSKKK